jgi:carboxyl-terminal processing protease
MSNRIRTLLITVSCLLVFYVVVGGLLGKNESTSEKTYRDLGVYSEVLSRIKQDYVTEPNLNKVTDGAIRGLLEALDPYSTYLTPEQYKDFLAHPQVGPADVGLFVSKRMGFATVVSVLPGSPAQKAGIKPGDLIDHIGDQGAREFSVVQIQRMLAGQPGTTVSVTIVHEARGEPITLTLTREILPSPPVVAKVLEDGTGYLRVATFSKGEAAQIAAKLHELEAKGVSKIVLDLRDCAGGDFQEAVDTASLFIDKGVITYLQGQRFPRQDLNAHPEGKVCTLPLAVLINQSTAGPAEVVAAGVLDNKRGQVVGTHSFGVGVYQKAIPVGDGSALLLSVAKYYTPDGKPITEGIQPSVVQAASNESASLEDEEEPTQPEQFGGKDDIQLQKAIEILNQSSATAKAA